MGQRHQIYLKLPARFYYEGNCNNRPETVIGIHHQWLYGQKAIKLCSNAMKFIKNQDEYGPLTKTSGVSDAMEALSSIYSLDIESGYYHQTHPLWAYKDDREVIGEVGAECKDPRKGDNNDGITIIDLTGEKPKYCFMSICHLECAEETREYVKNFIPMSAHDYVKAYYPKYEKETKVKVKGHDGKTKEVDNTEFHAESKKIVEFMAQFEVLTLREVKKIFPAMFKKEK
jgi:hypothetical protein